MVTPPPIIPSHSHGDRLPVALSLPLQHNTVAIATADPHRDRATGRVHLQPPTSTSTPTANMPHRSTSVTHRNGGAVADRASPIKVMSHHSAVQETLYAEEATPDVIRTRPVHVAATVPPPPPPPPPPSSARSRSSSSGARARGDSEAACHFPEYAGRYRVIRRVGAGSYGIVYLAEDLLHQHQLQQLPPPHAPSASVSASASASASGQREAGQMSPSVRAYVALKRVSHLSSDPTRIAAELSFLYRVAQGTSDQCVVQLLHHFESTHPITQEVTTTFVLNYVQHQRVTRWITQPHYSLRTVQQYMKALFTSLACIHRRGVIHRDVKFSNFLFDPSAPEPQHQVLHGPDPTPHHTHSMATVSWQRCKYGLIDFGLAQDSPAAPTSTYSPSMSEWKAEGSNIVDPSTAVPLPRACRWGTAGYRAPEVLARCSHQTTAIDVWSAGVLFLSLLCRTHPVLQHAQDGTALMEIITLIGATPDHLPNGISITVKRDGGRSSRNTVERPQRNGDASIDQSCAESGTDAFRGGDANGSQFRFFPWSCGSRPLGASGASSWSPSVCSRLALRCFHQSGMLFPAAAFDLLAHCLDLNPDTRITAEQALHHPFFHTGTTQAQLQPSTTQPTTQASQWETALLQQYSQWIKQTGSHNHTTNRSTERIHVHHNLKRATSPAVATVHWPPPIPTPVPGRVVQPCSSASSTPVTVVDRQSQTASPTALVASASSIAAALRHPTTASLCKRKASCAWVDPRTRVHQPSGESKRARPAADQRRLHSPLDLYSGKSFFLDSSVSLHLRSELRYRLHHIQGVISERLTEAVDFVVTTYQLQLDPERSAAAPTGLGTTVTAPPPLVLPLVPALNMNRPQWQALAVSHTNGVAGVVSAAVGSGRRHAYGLDRRCDGRPLQPCRPRDRHGQLQQIVAAAHAAHTDISSQGSVASYDFAVRHAIATVHPGALLKQFKCDDDRIRRQAQVDTLGPCVIIRKKEKGNPQVYKPVILRLAGAGDSMPRFWTDPYSRTHHSLGLPLPLPGQPIGVSPFMNPSQAQRQRDMQQQQSERDQRDDERRRSRFRRRFRRQYGHSPSLDEQLIHGLSVPLMMDVTWPTSLSLYPERALLSQPPCSVADFFRLYKVQYAGCRQAVWEYVQERCRRYDLLHTQHARQAAIRENSRDMERQASRAEKREQRARDRQAAFAIESHAQILGHNRRATCSYKSTDPDRYSSSRTCTDSASEAHCDG